MIAATWRYVALVFLVACGAGPNIPASTVSGGGSWSDTNTWGGPPPAPGTNIEVPAGKTVVLDRDTQVGHLTVNGVLEFADKDVTLSAKSIMVHGSGVFRIGSASKPFTNRATVTLTGSDASENIMGMGTKFLGAMMGGKIELFGEPRTTWLRLNATAPASTTSITLERDPGWRVGQQIVIAPSGYDALEAETRTITAVNGATLTLNAPLKYRHWGSLQTIDGQSLDERAEVGLLSRNIVITSDVETNATAKAAGLGGHVMVMAGSSGRFSSVEFSQLGQRGKMGRYGGPHWHLAGDANGQFVRGSSIHHSSNRFGSVHATNNVRLENNVAFDALGHGWILEDGVETGNVFEGNLAMLVRPVTSNKLIASDDQPSVYWMANPNNTFRNNVAAGSIGGNGFWYELPEKPTGLSASSSLQPQREPFGVFSGNVAHSNARVNDSVEVGAGLKFDQYINKTRMSGLTSYRNDVGIWLASATLSSDHRLDGFRLSSNRTQTLDTNSTITNALMVGTSQNTLSNEPDKEGVHVYDGFTSIQGGTIANYGPNDRFLVMRTTTESTDITSSFSNLRFVNSSGARTDLTSYFETHGGFDPATRDMLFDDQDGSLLGGAPAWIVYRNPLQLSSTCTPGPSSGAYTCPKSSNAYLRTGVMMGGSNQRLRRDDGASSALMGAFLRTGHTYRVEYTDDAGNEVSISLNTGFSPVALSNPTSAANWVRFVVPLPNWASAQEFQRAPAASLAALETGSGEGYYFDAGARELHVKVTANSENRMHFKPQW